MASPLLSAENLVKRFGGLTATDNLSLDVVDRELHAVIGPNGAGKTTLVAALSGELQPNSGSIRFAGADITHLDVASRSKRGIARSFQVTSILKEFTARENVMVAVQAHQGHSFRFWRDAWNEKPLRMPAEALLERVGLSGRGDVTAQHLAHGEQRQLEVAIALATRPKLLLLDEPMAGMGVEESRKMIDLLLTLKREHAILLIEHDMTAVFALADRISVLVYGKIIATGVPDEIRSNPSVMEAYLGGGGNESRN